MAEEIGNYAENDLARKSSDAVGCGFTEKWILLDWLGTKFAAQSKYDGVLAASAIALILHLW